MIASIAQESKNSQLFMIVWNLDLKFKQKVSKIDISTPLFSLNRNNVNEIVNWIHLERFDDKLRIESNFADLKGFLKCTTYILNPETITVIAAYKDFDTFAWTLNGVSWSQPLQFVFEVEMRCPLFASPRIWQHFDTETQIPLNANAILLNLTAADMAAYTVRSDQGRPCSVQRISILDGYLTVGISPENATENWDLLTVMLCKVDDNVYEWQFQHTTNAIICGKFFPKTSPVIIIEIMELRTTLSATS